MSHEQLFKIRRCLILLIIALLVPGCSAPTNTPSEFPFELLMVPSDLPAGWTRAGQDFPEHPGADTRLLYFEGSKDPDKEYLLVSHEFAVYGSETAAREYYLSWEDRWFPTSKWTRPDVSTFEPQNPDDLYRLACIHVRINENPIESCGYLQQHKNLLSLVLVNIDGETITLAQFEQALEQLDMRFQSYAEGD